MERLLSKEKREMLKTLSLNDDFKAALHDLDQADKELEKLKTETAWDMWHAGKLYGAEMKRSGELASVIKGLKAWASLIQMVSTQDVIKKILELEDKFLTKQGDQDGKADKDGAAHPEEREDASGCAQDH